MYIRWIKSPAADEKDRLLFIADRHIASPIHVTHSSVPNASKQINQLQRLNSRFYSPAGQNSSNIPSAGAPLEIGSEVDIIGSIVHETVSVIESKLRLWAWFRVRII